MKVRLWNACLHARPEAAGRIAAEGAFTPRAQDRGVPHVLSHLRLRGGIGNGGVNVRQSLGLPLPKPPHGLDADGRLGVAPAQLCLAAERAKNTFWGREVSKNSKTTQSSFLLYS